MGEWVGGKKAGPVSHWLGAASAYKIPWQGGLVSSVPHSGRLYRVSLFLPCHARRDGEEQDEAGRGGRVPGVVGEEARVEGALLGKGTVRAFKSR